MVDDDRRAPDEAQMSALTDLGRKLDTVAGALAAIAGSHSDLLAHVAEAEARRSHDAREVAQRLGALERQVLSLPTPPAPPPVDPLDPFPVLSVPADLENLRSDLALGLDVLAQVAESVQNLERRADEEAAALPRTTADANRAVIERIEELGRGLMLHTDLALAGALRVIDHRLVALKDALSGTGSGQPNVAGFEAGAVMGATQAAWTRLEQRLDAEFDDLGRQLQAMAALIEHTAAITESVANRPVLTGDQLRRAASAVKESVASAGRARRERRGGQRGIGSGPSEPSAG
jgi:hypothetical protein